MLTVIVGGIVYPADNSSAVVERRGGSREHVPSSVRVPRVAGLSNSQHSLLNSTLV